MAPQVVEVLERMKAGRNAPTGNLFTLDRPAIRPRLAKVYQDLGYKGRNTYTLRHTCASLMIRAGVPLEVVQKILGHTTIKMTLRYAHVADESMKEAVAKLGSFMQKASSDATGALKKA
jgi:integrase